MWLWWYTPFTLFLFFLTWLHGWFCGRDCERDYHLHRTPTRPETDSQRLYDPARRTIPPLGEQESENGGLHRTPTEE